MFLQILAIHMVGLLENDNACYNNKTCNVNLPCMCACTKCHTCVHVLPYYAMYIPACVYC